mmetsp:Transcript_20550/g.52416  ORF Transcript_20550/g.52416 Transcript_20550/m.52416 type:complete len:215 (-) Transcript_20550:386-1030(-)
MGSKPQTAWTPALWLPKSSKISWNLAYARPRIGPPTLATVRFTDAAAPLAFADSCCALSVASSKPLISVPFAFAPSPFTSALSVVTSAILRSKSKAAWPACAEVWPNSSAAESQPSASEQTRLPSGSTEQTPNCHDLAKARSSTAVRFAAAAAAVAAAEDSAPAAKANVASSALSPQRCISNKLLLSMPPHISFESPSQGELQMPSPPFDTSWK